MLKLSVIETPSCAYVSVHDNDKYVPHSLSGYFFDGKQSERTHHDDWFKIEKCPTKITFFKDMPNTNLRWVLRDKYFESKNIPLVITESMSHNIDVDGYRVWKPEYISLSSLYDEVSDPQPPQEINVDFEITEKVKLTEEIDFMGIKIPAIHKDSYKERTYVVTQENVEYQLLDRIIFPSLILHKRPCKISSKQSYDIVRQFIKTNINSEYAEITSDYDFCFTVQKKIELFEKEKYEINVAPPRARKARYETRYRKDRKVIIYEMTHSESCYKGHTPIRAFEGKDLQDLQDNIDIFCRELIKKINEPIKDCLHCKGMGVIFKNEIN